MPLLHKKPFTPERLPSDLRPDERVFVCKATQEVFRDYEKFFNRHFLSNSYVWTCSLTGQSNLTYTQAVESEREAQKLLTSFSQCYQRATLQLVHHARRTNVRSLGDELLVFFKERYVVGESLELAQTTSSGAKVLRPVRVLRVIPPEPSSPVRVSVISAPPSAPHGSPATAPSKDLTIHNGVVSHPSPPRPLTNGLSDSPPTGGSSPNRFKTPKAITPRTPLTPQANINPSAYKYVVETVEEPAIRVTASSQYLSRPKGQLHPKKLKLFLRNALQRPSEKHPFRVKEEYVQKFELGVSSVSGDPLPSPSPSSRSRKRSLSQVSLDSFLSPNTEVKRSRPASLDTSKHKHKGKGKTHKSRRQSGSKFKTPSSGTPKLKRQTPKVPSAPRTTATPGKTLRSQVEALKVLNKAKRFRQLDLKKSVIKKTGLSQEEVEELQRRAEEERRRWQEVWEEEKKRRREERMERLKALQEKKRLEKLRQRELMKPREDTLFTDSKPLPVPSPVCSQLPQELFGDVVMILEFLHSFGPLFNIREVIREGITFEKLERCLATNDTNTLLYDVVRFLVQAVFAAMEEDHEDLVTGKTVISQGGEEGEGEGRGGEEGRREEEMIVEEVEGEEEMKPLDIQVESICVSSLMFAQWSRQTQRLPLNQLVIDPYTCSEVLRLHLLTSGGYSDAAVRKRSRSYRRGGYTDGDNPAIALRLRRPDLLNALSRTSIYDLSPQDKLEVLSTLCAQLLTFSVARDHMDESVVQGKIARRKIRELQYGEERRKRESRQQRAKERKEKGKKPLAGNGAATTTGNGAPTNTGISTESEATAAQPADDSKPPETTLSAVQLGGKGGGENTPEDTPRETEEERKERLEEELAGLHAELMEATSSVGLQPLGSDRNHHRYWLFPNLPGLFVEDLGDLSFPERPLPSPPPLIHIPSTSSPPSHTAQSPSSANTLPPPPHLISSNDLMDLTQQPSPPPPVETPVTADSSREGVVSMSPVTDSRGGAKVRWLYYYSEEEVEQLLAALDVRGVREKALREALTLNQSKVLHSMHKCRLKTERQGKIRPSPPGTQVPLHYDSGDQYLELYLREQILDIEEKIHVGNLGHLRGAHSREEWREEIENSGAAALVNALREKMSGEGREREEGRGEEEGREEEEGRGEEEEREEEPLKPETLRQASNTPPTQMNPSVRMLSQALLEVEAGIESKFLMPPLGTAVDNKKQKGTSKKPPVKEADICREQWRVSLSQTTSFSQVFVHLATLERAVMWSRSLMNVRCRICRRKGGDEYMLLCDGCDHGYHTYCLKPPLQCVPEGDWFCHDCSPVTPVKPRKRTQRVTFQEVESSESEGGDGDGREVSEEEEEEEVISGHMLRSRRQGAGQRRSSRLKNKLQPKPTTKKTSKQKPVKPVVKAKKRLNLDPPRQLVPVSRAEVVVSSIIDLRCSRGSRGRGAVRREQRAQEMQLCEALLDEVLSQDCSWPFTEPVNKKEYPDYCDVVPEQIDLMTIRSKIKRGDYASLDGLVADMDLLFFNCQQFHRRYSEIGKAGVALKKFFDKRCSDLGLKDLELLASCTSSRTRLRSSDRKK